MVTETSAEVAFKSNGLWGQERIGALLNPSGVMLFSSLGTDVTRCCGHQDGYPWKGVFKTSLFHLNQPDRIAPLRGNRA